jgi:ethanolamine ammonia-lyase large subunit
MTSYSNIRAFAVSLYDENMIMNNNLVTNTTFEVLNVLESFYYVHGKYPIPGQKMVM